MAEVVKHLLVTVLLVTLIVPTSSFAQHQQQPPPRLPDIATMPLDDLTVGFLSIPKEQPTTPFVPTAEHFQSKNRWLDTLVGTFEGGVDVYAMARLGVAAAQGARKAVNAQFWRTPKGTYIIRGVTWPARVIARHPLVTAFIAIALQDPNAMAKSERERMLREIDKNIDEYAMRLWTGYATDPVLMASARTILNQGAALFKSKIDEKRLNPGMYSADKIFLARTPHAALNFARVTDERYWVDLGWLQVPAPTRSGDFDFYVEIPADVLIDPKPVEAVASYLAEAYVGQFASAADPVIRQAAGKHVTDLWERGMYFAKGLIGYYPTPENAQANYTAYLAKLMEQRKRQWDGIPLNSLNAKLYNLKFRPITIFNSVGDSTSTTTTCEVQGLERLFYGGISDCQTVPYSYFTDDLRRDVSDYFNVKELPSKERKLKWMGAGKIGAYGYVSMLAMSDLINAYRSAAARTGTYRRVVKRYGRWGGRIFRWSFNTVAITSVMAYTYFHFPEVDDILVTIDHTRGLPNKEDLYTQLGRFQVQLANGEFNPVEARNTLNKMLAEYGVSREDIAKGAREYRILQCVQRATWNSPEDCERDADNRTIAPPKID